MARRYSVCCTLNIVFRTEAVKVQRAEGVTAHVGLRAISVSSVNRKNWRLCTNGACCYPVGAGKMQEARADSETAVGWLSTRNEVEQERKGCFA